MGHPFEFDEGRLHQILIAGHLEWFNTSPLTKQRAAWSDLSTDPYDEVQAASARIAGYPDTR
jgi:hypothetical protein